MLAQLHVPTRIYRDINDYLTNALECSYSLRDEEIIFQWRSNTKLREVEAESARKIHGAVSKSGTLTTMQDEMVVSAAQSFWFGLWVLIDLRLNPPKGPLRER